jgi:ATP-dependent RNA helicase HelY
LPFDLDDFQRSALDALERGSSVVVAAPTGSGKTVVAEFAVELALRSSRRAFYTTPIKALSNQKYAELAERHGRSQVGLLTGDTAINESAPIVVMTTEVLRNMLYAGSGALHGLRYVVLDEVHFLQDAYRGSVWEEVIINVAPEVDLVCLSATVSNADVLADWISSIRGRTEVVVSDHRPIELRQRFMVGDAVDRSVTLLDVFIGGRPNPEGLRIDTGVAGRRGPRRPVTPRRSEVVEELRMADLLPALVFIFSRAGCDEAVGQLLMSGHRLTLPAERRRIRDLVERQIAALSAADRRALDVDGFAAALDRGIAAHHAGMVPAFREAVESCFVEGLVKVVFATETLALGINMPARTVVIEKLSKFAGTGHQLLSPAEYTQLIGRAGRRGIDHVGYAVTLWNPFTTFEEVAALASQRSFELRSAFRPTYNMAANLVRRSTRERAHDLLQRSFAQFQLDADLVRTHVRAERVRRDLSEAERSATCDRGDVEALRARRHLGRHRPPADDIDAIRAALRTLRPGSIITVDRRAGIGEPEPLIVVSRADRRDGEVRIRALSAGGKEVAFGPGDLRRRPDLVSTAALPSPFTPGTRAANKAASAALGRALRRRRDDTRAATRGAGGEEPAGRAIDGAADCPTLAEHLRAADRADALRQELRRIEAGATAKSGSIVAHFDRVLDVLERRGHTSGWALTASGTCLAGIFHESDLLVAECLDEGVFDGLGPPALAALVSSFVYERRGPAPIRRGGRDGGQTLLDLPRGAPKGLASRWRFVGELLEHLRDDERELGLPLTKAPDPGFVVAAHGWASGRSLERVLLGDDDTDVTGGDFVRTVRSLVDLLRQIAFVAPDPATAASARAASEALHRGVVSVASLAIPVGDDGGPVRDPAGADAPAVSP